MPYIPKEKLENLHKYKYSGVDKSLLSKYVLNSFWTWFVTLWPKTIAPNTITFLGLCLVMTNLATLIYYDPGYLNDKQGATGPPQWVYFTWAAGLFWYQAFDAIDGKQARRTGMAGPLGQMFDHGCDAMNTTFEVILASRALNLSRSWWTVASQVGAVANFYLTTWEEFHTGTLYLGYFSGPVDGIILIVIMYIVTGVYGTGLWDKKFLAVTYLDQIIARYAPGILYHIPNLGLNEAFYAFSAAGLMFNLAASYRNVYKARRAINKSPFTPLGRLTPFVISTALHLFWLNGAGPLGHGQKAYVLHSPLFMPFLLFWGFEFAHQVGRMILAHVTHQRFPYWDWTWVWSLVGAVDANSQYLFNRDPIIHKSPKAATMFMAASLVLSLVTYFRFCTLVIKEITEFLGIACFTVRKRDKDTGEWLTNEELNKKQG